MTSPTVAHRQRDRRNEKARKSIARTGVNPVTIGEPTETPEFHRSKKAEVSVTRHAQGWRLLGRANRFGQDDDHSHLEVEIEDCKDCQESEKPLCFTQHSAAPSINHDLYKCHELGHLERVHDLTQRILKTYR